MDTNADGKISPDEHAAGAAGMFLAMDADKNGKVTASEMSAAHGRVTGQKTTAGSLTMFERMDVDRDGFVTAAELATGHAQMLRKQ